MLPGQLDAADALGVVAVVEARVAEGEGGVRHRPGRARRGEAEGGDGAREPGASACASPDEQGRGQEAGRRGEDDDDVDERAPRVLGAGAVAGGTTASAGTMTVHTRAEQHEAADVPADERRGG